ncbi:MAG: hypothetical protein Q8Q33_10015 [Chlamydiota bacterium]|nr:hypothetical protein [Chlamydiota bacterium]
MKTSQHIINFLLILNLFSTTSLSADENKARTGAYQTSFREYSPLAHTHEMFARLLQPQLEKEYFEDLMPQYTNNEHPGYAFDIKDEIWNVFVTKGYSDQEAYGLFVWINADDNGAPRGDWKRVFRENKLIFIGAEASGNDHDAVLRRAALALHAVYNMKKIYHIDENRIYVSGYSGGGRVASWLAMGYGNVFTGGLFICGCNIPGGDQTKMPSKEAIKKIKVQNRYVFLTGDTDPNREITQFIYNQYQSLKIQHLKYIQIPGMGHDIPAPEYLNKAIRFLDHAEKQVKKNTDVKKDTPSLPPLKLTFD